MIARTLTLAVVTTCLSACGVNRPFEADRGFQADREFDKRIYAGGGVLLSNVEPDTSAVPSVSVDESSSAGASLKLGYDLSNRFAIEGHIADLGEAELAPAGSISYQVAGLSGVLYILNDREGRHLREGLSAFARLGVGTLNNDATGVRFRRINDVHLLGGAGLEYGFENGIALRGELMAHETDAKYVQLGVLYRFGGRSSEKPSLPVFIPAEKSDVEEPELVGPADDDLADVVTAPVPVPEPVLPEPPENNDSDLDGVLNGLDQCPGTEANLPVRADGCEIFNGVVEGISFLVGSADLDDNAKSVLDEVVNTLNEYPDTNVIIEAHTDNLGDAGDNLQLSRRRALAVTSYLVNQGIKGTRLRPQAFGESRPRAQNDTAEGRAANRRIELKTFK